MMNRTASGTRSVATPTRRRRLGILGMGGVTAALVACGQSASGTAGPPVRSAKPAKLTYMTKHAAGTVGMEKDEAQFRLFNRDHPHITVELAPVPSGPVKEKFVIQAASGTPAQLVQNDWGVWMDLARTGTIRELGSFFKTDKVNPEATFIPRAFEQYSHRGVMYGFPVSVSSDSFAYNMMLFDKAGIRYPPSDTADASWTLEAFLDVAQKLTNPGRQVGMMNTHNYPFNRGTWYGQRSWDDAKKQAFVNHPSHIKGQQFWVDLMYRYRVIPTSDEAKQLAGGAKNAFFSGTAAMMYTCCPHGLKDAQFPWRLATLPYSGPAGTPNMAGRTYPHGLHMAKGIPQGDIDAIWTLFRWYMSRPDRGGLMPPANSHIVAPYKDPRYSEIAQREFEQLTGGVSGKAPLRTAQHTPPSGCGMLKYDEYNDAWDLVKDDWGKAEANQLPVADWANRTQQVIEDAKLGSKGLS